MTGSSAGAGQAQTEGAKAPLEAAERLGWDGSPLHDGYLYHHESFRLAREMLAGFAAADRAFGGDGNVVADDPALRVAATLLWLEQNMVALASSALDERVDASKVRLTARAVLDYFPEPGADATDPSSEPGAVAPPNPEKAGAA